MEYERNLIWDGFISLERGMDSGRVPASLDHNQASFAVNTTFRGGYPECRPGWIKRALSYPDSDGTTDNDLWEAFQDGQFQGASYYDAITGKSSLIAAINGKLYRVSPMDGFEVTDVSPATANSTRLTKAWFCQAEEFLVVQDGQSKPIVYNGSESFRLTQDRDLPVGKAMAYGQGRIWLALPDGFSFIASDICYGDSGSSAYEYRDAVLRVTENTFLNEGGAFAMPANSGGITSLTFTNNLDTSLGQGPLLVFTPNLVASCQAPIDRNTWKDLTYPIQTVALFGKGALSDTSTVTVNGDVFYRAADGIRSFILARRDFSQWGNTPVSAEMNRVLVDDTEWLLGCSSATVFDNRFLITVSPYFVQGHGVAHRGLAVMDFDILSRMYGKQAPAWEGIWTGLNILQIVAGRFGNEERCFAFVLNASKQIELWELSKDYPHDYGAAGDSRITWSVEPKSLAFQSPFALKQLEYGEIYLDKLRGDLTVKAWYRPDGYAKWVDWHSEGWTESATATMTTPAVAVPPSVAREQDRNKMRLPRPSDTFNDSDDKPMRQFFTVQPRLEFTGKARLRQLRIAARPEQEHARGAYRT